MQKMDSSITKKTIEARPYQLELVDYLMERNGIVYLPTGAGKTFIAILILKRFQHTLQKTIKDGGKRAIFMCNTVELSRQQYKEIQSLTNLKVGLYIGARDVDSWLKTKWSEEIDEHQVLVGTPQVFVNIVSQNFIKISDLSVVIIDECHHASGSHPMSIFMSLFQSVDSMKLPRVVGLTGVLIMGSKFGNVENDLRKLEITMRGNIITVRNTDQLQNVMVFSTKPSEVLVSYGSNRHIFRAEEKVKRIINECHAIVDNYNLGATPLKMSKSLVKLMEPSKTKYIKSLLNDFIYQMDEFGLYAAMLAIMSPIIDFEVKKRQAETMALRNLYRVVIQYCERIRHIIVKELKGMLEPDVDESGNVTIVKDKDVHNLDIISNYSTPKLRALLSYITEQFKGKEFKDISCLIFVHRRYTAKCIYHVLRNYVELRSDLRDVVRPQFMVGRFNIITSIENTLDTNWNTSAIDEFRRNICNVIVCSNVLEEGIDVQTCNYVFAFDPLLTFNSYIQTKGRARSQNSVYAIFVSDLNEIKTTQQVEMYRLIHERIKNFLTTRILDLEDPNEEEIAEQFETQIPPFVIPSGARLLASSALFLLHRYCHTLPWDSFGSCQPWYCKLQPNNKGEVSVSVKLPLQSSVKETIISDYMKSVKEAKISAAFKACIRLYENGELNSFLLPVTKAQCIAQVSKSLFAHWKKFDDNICEKTVGRQNRRLYDRKCPHQLFNAVPEPKEKCYAYAIEFTTEFNVNTYNEHIVKYLNTRSSYAIMVKRKLPKLAEMPLFMSQGKLRVKISDEPIECIVHTAQELLLLKRFHCMIFRDILNMFKEFLVMDNRNMENSYMIVPLNENHIIDWGVVENFQRLERNRPLTSMERLRTVHYNPNEYLDKVVTKWYNEVESERFVVTKIRYDLNPLSTFESANYDTYESFYRSRYNVNIVNKEQFLLEVKPLTHRRNFFNNASNKSVEKKRERSIIILVPELCHNYHYPANLWLKALFLPSVLHRVYFMLHAESLRCRINQYLGLERYFINYAPKPLIVDSSLKRVLDDDDNPVKNKDHHKKLLPSLPTKQHNEDYQVRSLDSTTTQWKSYLEPIDLNRVFDRSYPVEIDYYYKFISVRKMEDLKLKEEDEWTKSQLDVCYPSKSNKSSDRSIRALPIKDSDRTEKSVIEILKKNFEPDHALQSAEQYEFLAALTTAGVNDVFDMERYEVLGDAFLKFAISLYLANKYTTWNEGFLSVVKGGIVSNRNLLYCLMGTDICKCICSAPFKPGAWLPPLYALPANLLQLLAQNLPDASILEPANFYNLELTEDEISSGECLPEKLEHFVQVCNKNRELVKGKVNINLENEMNLYLYKDVLPDKVVADTLEAILGVCVKNYGISRSFRMLEFFGICKSEKNNPLTGLLDLKLSSNKLRTNSTTSEINGFLANAEVLEKNLGYSFKDRAYLLQAVTHPSYPTNRLTGCYQELEFIGDAILDMLMTSYIFERHQNMDPGKITDLRSALVNNITLACICVRYRFHLFVLYESVKLAEAIKTFEDFQKTQDYRVTDQVQILMEESNNTGFNFDNNEDPDDNSMSVGNDNLDVSSKINMKYNISKKIDVPKILGDIVEALIGAVYLDCRDLQKTWQVIYNLFENELNEFSCNVPIDPVRQLGEIKQANAKYSDALIDNDIVMVKCIFNCLDKKFTTNGFGSNGVQAKKAAAKQALQILAKYSN